VFYVVYILYSAYVCSPITNTCIIIIYAEFLYMIMHVDPGFVMLYT